MGKKQFAIIGAGKVGSTLAVALFNAGYKAVAVSSRTNNSAKQLAERLAIPRRYNSPDAVKQADLVWICTPDRMIGPVADQLAENGAFRPGQYVYHLSGTLTSEVLKSAAGAGAHTGVMHPLQSFAAKEEPEAFRHVYFGLEGDPLALELAKAVVQDLEGRSLVILPEQKALYHAAACVASNYFVVLINYAVDLLQQVGFSRQDSLAALLPLLRGSIGNLARQGTRGALTGPIARADVDTVKKHLRAMEEYQVDQRLYRVLGEYAAAMAETSGMLNQEGRLAIQTILRGEKKDEE